MSDAEHESNTRKTITVDQPAFDRCAGLKRDGESWSEFLRRAADAVDSDDEHGLNTLTEGHIDDIAAETARRTADELEARFR